MKQSKLDQKDMEQTSQNWYSVFVPWDLNQVSLDELFLILCHLWRPFGNDFRPLNRLLSQHQHTPTPLELHLKGDMETKIPQTKRQSNWTSRLKKNRDEDCTHSKCRWYFYIFWWEKIQGLKHLTFGANFNQSPSAWESKLIIGRLHWKTSPVRCVQYDFSVWGYSLVCTA